MSDKEKIEKIQFILRSAIFWYKEGKRKQKLPEDHDDHWDSSAVYDMSIDQFCVLSRGDAEKILEILSEG